MPKELCRIEYKHPVRSILWSKSYSDPSEQLLIATGLQLKSNNFIQTFHLDCMKHSIVKGKTHYLKTPITKMKTMKLNNQKNSEFLITTSMDITITSISKDMDFSNSIILSPYVQGKRSGKRQYPISSFAIVPESPSTIYAAMYNSIIDVWDLENGVIRQSIASKDKECYDIDICQSNSDLFVSVGLAGLIHIHDIRNNPVHLPDFKMKHDIPLLRVSWCPNNTNYIAAIPLEDPRVFIYDIRCTSKPCSVCSVHSHFVNDLYWHPKEDATVLSTDAAGNCMQWSIFRENLNEDMMINHQLLFSGSNLSQCILSPFSPSHFITCQKNAVSYIQMN